MEEKTLRDDDAKSTPVEDWKEAKETEVEGNKNSLKSKESRRHFTGSVESLIQIRNRDDFTSVATRHRCRFGEEKKFNIISNLCKSVDN